MFGNLPAPCRCQIGSGADLYRSAFCGLCNALAAQYGPPARFLINRDSTFVALLAAAQSTDPPDVTRSRRCLPWSRPMPVLEAGPAPAFAAAVTLCGLQAKLEDELADEHGLRAAGCRTLKTLSRSRFDRAGETLRTSAFPVADIRRDLAGQVCAEERAASGQDPAAAARPSAHAFGSILAHTARLAGSQHNTDPLYNAGCSLGELAYTLDAYQDLAKDRRRGRFNYLACQGNGTEDHTDDQIRQRARQIAARCQEQIDNAWRAVEVLRYRPVLEAVLLTALPARTERVLAAPPGYPLVSTARDDRNQEPDFFDQDSNAYFGSGNDATCCCYCCDCCDCCNSETNGCPCDCGSGDTCCCDGGGDCGGCDCNC